MGYFSIPLAQLVGSQGKVICIDLQQQMLDGLRRRAEKAGVLDTIAMHRCEPTRLGLPEPVDFVLAFWMLHEVPDQAHSWPRSRRISSQPGVSCWSSRLDM